MLHIETNTVSPVDVDYANQCDTNEQNLLTETMFVRSALQLTKAFGRVGIELKRIAIKRMILQQIVKQCESKSGYLPIDNEL